MKTWFQDHTVVAYVIVGAATLLVAYVIWFQARAIKLMHEESNRLRRQREEMRLVAYTQAQVITGFRLAMPRIERLVTATAWPKSVELADIPNRQDVETLDLNMKFLRRVLDEYDAGRNIDEVQP